MAEFAYNNAKNANTDHTSFELNYDYYSWMLYEEKVNPNSQSKSADKLSEKLKELIIVCCKNLYFIQKLQKLAYDKGIKPWNYALGKKIWLNNKYIKTKWNCKLEAKFLRPF